MEFNINSLDSIEKIMDRIKNGDDKMSLLCIKCKNLMELVDEYSPPYPDPSETVYYCSECNIEAVDSECYGIEYYDKKTHYRIVDSKGE